MKVLITLGPTQEPIDEVRYITNASSGKMGAALAREALRRGYETAIVAGPVEIELPCEAKIIRVRTAKEMIDSTLKELGSGYDLFVSTAAIADYSPKKESGKIRSGSEEISLRLKPNPKLTRLVRERFPEVRVIGFKAEHGLPEKELSDFARKKLETEDLDMVVANDVGKVGFGSDKSEVHIVRQKRKNVYIPINSKDNIARHVWNAIEGIGD